MTDIAPAEDKVDHRRVAKSGQELPADDGAAEDAAPRDLIGEAKAEGGVTAVPRVNSAAQVPQSDLYRSTPPVAPTEPALPQATPKADRMQGDSTFNKLPRVTDDASFDALKPGMKFVDPDGQQRTKPYFVRPGAQGELDFDKVPDGATFVDSEGNTYQKPTFDGVSFTTQTLWDMAGNDSERKKILAREFGDDSVKQDHRGHFYAEQDGKFFKPGEYKGLAGQTKRAGAFAAAAAAPTIGAVGGSLVAGVPGAAGGAIAGQHLFNDAILGLAGVYDRSLGEELTSAGITGVTAGAGEVAGRALGGAAPAAMLGKDAAKRYLPRVAARYTGADVDPEATKTALRLNEAGVLVSPSGWMKESPYLHTVVDVFDPKFRTQKPVEQSAVAHYEREGGRILDEAGSSSAGRESLAGQTSKPVSAEAAGQKILDRVTKEMVEKDAALAKAMEEAQAQARTRAATTTAQGETTQTALQRAHQEARAAADNVIDQGFKSIETDIVAAGKASSTGNSPGDWARRAAEQIRALNGAIKARATKLYDAADRAAGSVRPALTYVAKDGENQSLSQVGKEFLKDLPKPFQDKHPDIVKKITQLKEGETTFGQLRNLRSLLRQDIDYNDLTPSMHDGAYKKFAGLIDSLIHSQTAPELKAAAKLLDDTDAFYAKNMKRFRDETVKDMVKAVEAGWPPDAEKMAASIFTEGQSERISGIRKIVGPGLWNALQHADVQSMLNSAMTTVPGVVDTAAFARAVLERVRTGVLKNAYSPALAEKVTAQANRILQLDGKLPLKAVPDETLASFMSRADKLATEIEHAAKVDPMGTLDTELKGIGKQFKKSSAELRAQMRSDPLGFLYNSTAGANKSAERILNDPDLFLAAAMKFGAESPEFEMLRITAAHRLLQNSSPGTMLGRLQSGKLPESVQEMIFPGTSRADMVRLAKDMDFLLGSRDLDRGGASIAAQSRVLHPTSSLLFGDKIGFKVPGVDALARSMLGKYYSMVTNAVNNPAVMRFIAKGLEGTPEQREAAKAAFQKWSNVGGAVGAGAAEAIEQGSGDPN